MPDSLTLHLDDVRVTLPAETVDALAAVLARRLRAQAAPDASPFLTVAEAAAYIRASRQRVYDLLEPAALAAQGRRPGADQPGRSSRPTSAGRKGERGSPRSSYRRRCP